jgi:hypothetical protein
VDFVTLILKPTQDDRRIQSTGISEHATRHRSKGGKEEGNRIRTSGEQWDNGPGRTFYDPRGEFANFQSDILLEKMVHGQGRGFGCRSEKIAMLRKIHSFFLNVSLTE